MTLIMIGTEAEMRKLPVDLCFHITIVDHKPAVIARDLLILLMLDELASAKSMKAMFKTALLHVLYYTYLSPIMPRKLYLLLQIQIRKAIDSLEGRYSLPAYIDVPNVYRPETVRVLKEWQKEASKEYPTSRVRKEAVRSLGMEVAKSQMYFGGDGKVETPKGCEKQEAFYLMTGILMMSPDHDKVIASDLPELRDAFEHFDVTKPQRPSDELLKSVDKSWETNVTMVDLEWQRNREDWFVDLDVAHNPFEIGARLDDIGMVIDEVGRRGLFDYVMSWFVAIANCVRILRHRIKIEACIGDVACVLEQIKFGTIGHRQIGGAAASDQESTGSHSGHENQGSLEVHPDAGSLVQQTASEKAATDPPERSFAELNYYPKMYDRVHLSNIPDYIGGTLTSFMYALPLTWPNKESYITSNCLRNPPRWQSIAHFNNEYIGLSAPSDLEKTFRARMAPADTKGPSE